MKYHPIERVVTLFLLQFLLVVRVVPLFAQEEQESEGPQEEPAVIEGPQEEPAVIDSKAPP